MRLVNIYNILTKDSQQEGLRLPDDLSADCESRRENEHDRMVTQNKTGWWRNSLHPKYAKIQAKTEYEISSIETIWAENEVTNAKQLLVCSVYRPSSAHSEWVDLFEEELSIAQAAGLEFILMGDFHIDLNSCINKKWSNVLQIFDLSQFVREPTHVTRSSATLIDHVYSSHFENISSCLVSNLSICDHFLVCFSRKINSRISKVKHITTSYRCFKHCNENNFLSELTKDLETKIY